MRASPLQDLLAGRYNDDLDAFRRQRSVVARAVDKFDLEIRDLPGGSEA